ncbi:MAG TPA: carboxylesterase family protein, partial [Hyphomonas atlantica]|nr:carboxylesterase family protein [Hyphomonas atlantica]
MRTIAQGEVVGTSGAADTMAWYGIPFAAPPVGELRWRAPRPAEAWAGRYEAIKPDRECVQYDNLFDGADADWTLTGSEDCLYLNVWAPSDAGDQPLPVMVWIHGGANIGGSAGMYEMGHLAAQGDVIVVAINYRLAMLGWFAHPSLVATAETDLDRSMNFALLDQIAALEWVQENISAFGGDVENVTVFGQSAGAFNIAALMSSPLSDGLFHKAIMQSGGFQSAAYEDAVSGSASNLANSVSADTFIEAMVEAGGLPPQNEVTPETLAEHLRALPLKD